MALDAEIIALLSGIKKLGSDTATGRRPIVGASPQDRLQAIVKIVGDTVLPRSYTFFANANAVAMATVASGRLLKLLQYDAEASSTPEPGADARDVRLANAARSLARLAHLEGELTIETSVIAENLAAEDVGQTETELRDYCSEREWFKDAPGSDAQTDDQKGFFEQAKKLTLAQTQMDRGGSITDRSGDEAHNHNADISATLAQEVADWQTDIVELAGMPCMIVRQGPTDHNAVSLAITPDHLVISTCDNANVPAMVALWNSSQANESSTE
jgi:hypothetical protein